MFNSRRWGKSFDGYTGVTGFFNADYKAVHSDYTEYWHEGIDFRGPQGTAVHSLVQGTVLRCHEGVLLFYICQPCSTAFRLNN